MSSNWNRALTITVNGLPRNLIDHYGSTTENQVHAHVLTYVHQPTRNAQVSAQIYQALAKSLSLKAKNTLYQDEKKYTFFSDKNAEPFQDGIMFLKMIIKRSSIVTIATVTHLNEQLIVLDQKMVELDSNVAVFNEHYLSLIQQLKAHG